MGIKGTVRRATDGHIIHANVDTDVVVSEEPPFGSTRKPDELYQLIERFALGERCWCSVFWLSFPEFVAVTPVCQGPAPVNISRTCLKSSVKLRWPLLLAVSSWQCPHIYQGKAVAIMLCLRPDDACRAPAS